MSEQQDAALAIEQVLIGGDLKALTPAQRLNYYKLLCEALKLNYLTRPFEYVEINKKLILYARRDATDQLRRIHNVAIKIVDRVRYEDVYVVTAQASTPEGRTDESIGAISLAGLRGVELANAMMKCETKAKRRVTLSIVGLGWNDESEIENIPGALLGTGATVKQIAPARKFSDLSDDEKRERLTSGWHKQIEILASKGIDSLPLPDFENEDIETLITAAGILAALVREEDAEKISALVQRLADTLEIIKKEDTNGDDLTSSEG